MTRSVEGTWTAHQGNGFEVQFTIIQHADGTIRGSASTTGLSCSNCQGKLDDDRFALTVPWEQNESVGEYTANFSLNDRLVGVTVDLNNPGSVTQWSTTKRFLSPFTP